MNSIFCRSNIIHKLLWEAHQIAKHLSEGRIVILQSGGPENVEVDCILSSLVQLMADSNYYTIKGFCYLIDKEWFCYGYRFITTLPSKTLGYPHHKVMTPGVLSMPFSIV